MRASPLGMRLFKRPAAAAVAGFSPASLTGLKLWIEADPAKLYTDAGTTLVSADGQSVQQANDKSSNAWNLLQGAAGQRPIYKTGSGKPYLQFDGVDDEITSGSHSFTDGSGQFYAAFSYYLDSITGNQGLGQLTGNPQASMWVGSGSNDLRTSDNVGSTTDEHGLTVNAAEYHVYIATVTTTAAEVFVDNSSSAATSLTGTRDSNTAAFILGGGFAALSGRIYGCVIGSGTLNSSDRSSLQAYMAALHP